MILAEKILQLRKDCGWSQEDLAERLNVSRQSVSKWESASSIPDISKILEMSKLFGVTTDYLIKDEQEAAEYAPEEAGGPRRVSLGEANDYMSMTETWRRQLARGVSLCILSPITLLLLGGVSELNPAPLSEDMAGGLGVIILLLMIAVAVAIFINGDLKMKRFEYLEKEDFELEYGVAGIVRQRRDEFAPRHKQGIILGVSLCILSPIPLLVCGMTAAADLLCLLATCFLLLLVSIAVRCFVLVGALQDCYDCLLGEGDYDRAAKARNRSANRLGGIFWPLVVAVYLAWSFITNDWRLTWLVWPVAALVFAALSAALHKED